MGVPRTSHRPRGRVLAVALGIAVVGAGAAGAQASVDVPAQAIALNRTGRWKDAAAAATRRLADATITAEERCVLFASAGYSFTRLDQVRDATAAVDAFDRQCAGTPIEPGFRTAVVRVRADLAGRPGAAPAPPLAPLDLDALPRAGRLSREQGTTTAPWPLRSNADGFWGDADPGTAQAAFWLTSHNDLCARTGADACLVLHGGRIVSEWYRAGAPDSLAAMSSTKSVTGLLAMMLLADRKLPNVDVPVCRFVHVWCGEARTGATVRHLLTMTSGLATIPTDSALWATADMDAFVAQLRPVAPPGTRWAYSNEGAQLLSPVLDRAAGEPIQRYAARRLFGPLGMRDTHFHVDAAGQAATYANLRTTPRDFARLGVLVLQHGRWRGQQLVPGALMDSLVRPSQRLNPTYGMLWWRLRTEDGSLAYVTRGSNATNMYVFPAQDVVVVRMQHQPLPGNLHRAYEPAALPLFHALFQAFAPAHWH